MKRYFVPLICLIIVISLAISAFAPMNSVELPEELVNVLGMLVMLLFTALARWLLSFAGIDIQDKLAEIASGVAAILVVTLNHYLAFLPATYDSWLSAVFAFFIVLFGGNGVYGLLFRKKKRG